MALALNRYPSHQNPSPGGFQEPLRLKCRRVLPHVRFMRDGPHVDHCDRVGRNDHDVAKDKTRYKEQKYQKENNTKVDPGHCNFGPGSASDEMSMCQHPLSSWRV
ncbi:hypothetical protein HAX54_001868 [Datura stramonium]|uniref:Uncharacterized protein n=1 Tax=Datura stramonium TaxID=4076 RepID=A0ABS8T323_DATST|nr:hypothetical protein [Datura stramonium]